MAAGRAARAGPRTHCAAGRLQRLCDGRPGPLAARTRRLDRCLRRCRGGAALQLRLPGPERAPGPCLAEPGPGAAPARRGRVAHQCRRTG